MKSKCLICGELTETSGNPLNPGDDTIARKFWNMDLGHTCSKCSCGY